MEATTSVLFILNTNFSGTSSDIFTIYYNDSPKAQGLVPDQVDKNCNIFSIAGTTLKQHIIQDLKLLYIASKNHVLLPDSIIWYFSVEYKFNASWEDKHLSKRMNITCFKNYKPSPLQ